MELHSLENIKNSKAIWDYAQSNRYILRETLDRILPGVREHYPRSEFVGSIVQYFNSYANLGFRINGLIFQLESENLETRCNAAAKVLIAADAIKNGFDINGHTVQIYHDKKNRNKEYFRLLGKISNLEKKPNATKAEIFWSKIAKLATVINVFPNMSFEKYEEELLYVDAKVESHPIYPVVAASLILAKQDLNSFLGKEDNKEIFSELFAYYQRIWLKREVMIKHARLNAQLANYLRQYQPITTDIRRDNAADVNATEKKSIATLIQAVMDGNLELARKLYSQGEKADITFGSRALTLLHLAAKYGHDNMIPWLVSIGLDVNATAKLSDSTPLHIAVANGNTLTARALISASANPNCKRVDGETPLHLASKIGAIAIVEFLLESNADVNLLNSMNESPLHIAKAFRHEKISKLLLAAGASTDTSSIKNSNTEPFCKRKQVYNKVLLNAARGGSDSKMMFALYEGADINCVVEGKSIIHWAVIYNQPTTINFLAENNYDLNKRCAEKGWTALHYAIKLRKTKVVETLLLNKANTEVRTNQDETALHLAVKQNLIHMVELLINHGADKNAVINNDENSLFIACSNNKLHVMAYYLLNKGIDPNIAKKTGETALHRMTNSYRSHEFFENFTLFFEKGFDASRRFKGKNYYEYFHSSDGPEAWMRITTTLLDEYTVKQYQQEVLTLLLALQSKKTKLPKYVTVTHILDRLADCKPTQERKKEYLAKYQKRTLKHACK